MNPCSRAPGPLICAICADQQPVGERLIPGWPRAIGQSLALKTRWAAPCMAIRGTSLRWVPAARKRPSCNLTQTKNFVQSLRGHWSAWDPGEEVLPLRSKAHLDDLLASPPGNQVERLASCHPIDQKISNCAKPLMSHVPFTRI